VSLALSDRGGAGRLRSIASHAPSHDILAQLLQDQGRSTLGRVLGEMKISTAKKQVVQSIAGQFPCNAVLYKWGKAPLAACTLYGHHAETECHIQCLCLALKGARIRAHHNIAQRCQCGRI
jgi:hypothetical protein